jgi:hypothetical protein
MGTGNASTRVSFLFTSIEQFSDRIFSHFDEELSRFDGRGRSNRIGAD